MLCAYNDERARHRLCLGGAASFRFSLDDAMPDHNAIADVSLTLRNFLRRGLTGIVPGANVDLDNLLAPIGANDLRVTIFLFEIEEDASVRNRPRVREQVDDRTVRIRKPHLALLLRYLITPWSPEVLTEQRILGRIAQVFYEQPIISGSELAGTTLSGTSEALKVTMKPFTLEDRTRIWNAVQKPYHVSATYDVRVVNVDAAAGMTVPTVGRRDAVVGQLEPAP